MLYRCTNLTLNMIDYVYLVGCGSSVVGAPLQNFGNFVYPILHVSLAWDTITCWSFLCGVYARGRGSKIPHTG